MKTTAKQGKGKENKYTFIQLVTKDNRSRKRPVIFFCYSFVCRIFVVTLLLFISK